MNKRQKKEYEREIIEAETSFPIWGEYEFEYLFIESHTDIKKARRRVSQLNYRARLAVKTGKALYQVKYFIPLPDEVCPVCGARNFYNYEMSTLGGGYHIGCAGWAEWECGKCHSHLVEMDAPYLSECYTHVNYDELEEA